MFARCNAFVKFSLVSSSLIKAPVNKLRESREPQLRPAVVVFVSGKRVVKATYLLPCSCGAKVPIDRVHAGQTIQCACGRSLTVPSLLAMSGLEPAESEEEPPPAGIVWGIPQRLTVVGMVVLGLAAAGFLWTLLALPPPVDPSSLQTLDAVQSFAQWRKLTGHPLTEVIGTPNAIHEMARSIPIDRAFVEVLKVKQRGLDRGLTREDDNYRRAIAIYRLWCGILAGVGAVGIGLIAGGVLACLRSSRA